MGITRVANVTGLDSIGIPVVMVCRPNSRSVTVSQGKGIDLASARVSGLMEAAELYHAETITLPLRLCTYEELRHQYNVVEIDDLPYTSDSRFHSNLRLPWCQGRDLLSGKDVFVPYEMVHTNYTIPFPDGHGCFTASSNGLASGNLLVEAISHGICEVVERDAATLWQLRGKQNVGQGRLDLKSADDLTCRELIDKIERAGLTLAVWNITSDIKLAAFICYILPLDDCAVWHSSIAVGYGCHPTREIALMRAITEAAQARLTMISGLRDDIRRGDYKQALDPEVLEGIRKHIATSNSLTSFRDVPNFDGEILEDDLEWEMDCLRKVGVRHVVVVDLTKRGFELPVVRVIVPGLEPMFGSDFRPGERARAFLKEQS